MAGGERRYIDPEQAAREAAIWEILETRYAAAAGEM
jgi:hypothetical protein